MRLRHILALACICLGVSGISQIKANPLLQVLHTKSMAGIQSDQTHEDNPVNFKRNATRKGVDAFVSEVFESKEERSLYKDAIVEFFAELEKQLDTDQLGTDPTVAVALTASTLHSLASGEEVSDDTLAILIGQARAIFNHDSAKKATDQQKQEFFEYSLSHMALPVLVFAQAESDVDKKRVSVLAASMLSSLLGTPSENISVTPNGLQVKRATAGNQAPHTGELAPGFTVDAGTGFVKDGDWYIHRIERGQDLSMAMFRLLPAIPAEGNMGDALRKVWTQAVPPPLKDKASGLVFRRFVGDGLLTNFIFGKGREEHKSSDTVFTLYLVDCGSYWQPIIFAQTYEQLGVKIGEDFSAGFTYSQTAEAGEPFLAAIRCPAAKKSAIADVAAVAGNYSYGSNSNLQWVNVYTGATSWTFVSYGGDLNLKTDKTFTYTYTGVSGSVGAATFAKSTGSGTWEVQGDLLIVQFNKYEQSGGGGTLERRVYKIAGITQFPDGEKIAIFMDDEGRPANQSTVMASGDNFFTTKKK